MAYNDILTDLSISAARFTAFLARPFTRITAEGDIDSTNKKYSLPTTGHKYYPIFPKNMRTILPIATDVVVESIKSTTYAPLTLATLNPVDTIIDPDTGDTVYGAVNLATALAPAEADDVLISGWEVFQIQKLQNLAPAIKQDKNSESIVGTDVTIQQMGSIDQQWKADINVNRQAFLDQSDIFYEADDDQDGVPEGFEVASIKQVPTLYKGYINVEDPADLGTVLARYYMSGIAIDFDSPAAKAGDTSSSMSFNLNIADPLKMLRRKQTV